MSGTQYSCTGSAAPIFDNSNIFGVSNGGNAPSFSTNGPYCLTQIITYHWNNGQGMTPGTLGLTGTNVVSGFATSVGPIQAVGTSGQNNAPNVNWIANVTTTTLINGTYTCADSDPSTWSYDSESGGYGFCQVWGIPATVVTPPPPNPPTVTSVSPASGPNSGGTSVTITGTGFSTGGGATVFDFGAGDPATNVTCGTPNACTATTPGGSGTVDVLATAGGLTSSPNAPADQFTYVAPPTVTSVTPASGSNAGGTAVTIGGTGFSTAAGATVFDFGPANAAGNIVCTSLSSCTATAPSGSGTVDVFATVDGLTSAANPPGDQFSYLVPPTVTRVSPNVGSLFGSQVTITGTGFSTAGGSTVFDFGPGQAAGNVLCSSSTSCTAFSPAEPTGTVDVTATVGGLTSASNPPADQFTYSSGPAVTSVTPSIGPIGGGTSVAIGGTGFSTTGGMTFYFGLGLTSAPNVVCTSSTSCTATSPLGLAPFPIVDVVAVVGGGESPANPPGDQFTYFRTTTTALTSDHDPANPNQAVDYTATISPAPLQTPPPSTGTVSFSADGTPIPGCTAVAITPGASGPLPQEAQATATCTQTFTSTGNHAITATFTPGAPYFTGSTSAPLNQVVANCGASLQGCNLKGLDLSGLNLAGQNLKGDNLQGANLTNANLSKANLNGANLQGATLTGANLNGATMQGANFKGANLANAQLQGDLTGANLSGATLSGADLEGAILNGANLSGVVAINADFQFAHLMGTNLSPANLQGANFTFADLRQANLANDYLANANLSNADIGVPPTATFTGANLTGATLFDLFGTPGNAFNKVIWGNTICPDGTSSNADGGTCLSNFL